MHPFDLKSALLAKHAQHVVLIHFPIALFLMGAGFDFAARWTKEVTKRATLMAAARLNLLAAALFVVPTLASGILAWQWTLGGKRPKGLLLLHLVLGCASSILVCLAGWIRLRQRRAENSSMPLPYLLLEALTAGVVILTAHLGGFLSGVNVGG